MVFILISFFGTRNQNLKETNKTTVTDSKTSAPDDKSNKSSTFDLLLLNCQGLTTKINYIYTEYITNNDGLKFLCFTEIWYDAKKSKIFDNFNISSCYTRKNHIRGGVGIWSHSSLQVKTINIEKFCIEKDIEVCVFFFLITNQT